MAGKIAGVTDVAVAEATGEPWAHWLELLDEAGGADIDHRERVAALADAGVESGWWRQKLAVGYEQQRGLREVGETAGAGYQVGVQRTLPVDQEQLWDVLTMGAGLAAWLDVTGPLALEPGESFEASDGTTGEIRTVSEGERLRLTWQPADRESPTTLQMTLTCPRNDASKTVLRFHHEHLNDAAEREAMRERWREVLDRIADLVEHSSDAGR